MHVAGDFADRSTPPVPIIHFDAKLAYLKLKGLVHQEKRAWWNWNGLTLAMHLLVLRRNEKGEVREE
jgi:hypothetical protein